MSEQVKVNGSWKTASAIYVKVNGSWKSVSSGYSKVNGSWKTWSSGGSSPAPVSFAAPPTRPSSPYVLNYSTGNTSATFLWQLGINSDSVRMYLNGAIQTTIYSDSNSYTFANLIPNSTYEFRLVGYDSHNNIEGDEYDVSLTPGNAASNCNEGQVANSKCPSGFSWICKNGCVPCMEIASVPEVTSSASEAALYTQQPDCLVAIRNVVYYNGCSPYPAAPNVGWTCISAQTFWGCTTSYQGAGVGQCGYQYFSQPDDPCISTIAPCGSTGVGTSILNTACSVVEYDGDQAHCPACYSTAPSPGTAAYRICVPGNPCGSGYPYAFDSNCNCADTTPKYYCTTSQNGVGVGNCTTLVATTDQTASGAGYKTVCTFGKYGGSDAFNTSFPPCTSTAPVVTTTTVTQTTTTTLTGPCTMPGTGCAGTYVNNVCTQASPSTTSCNGGLGTYSSCGSYPAGSSTPTFTCTPNTTNSAAIAQPVTVSAPNQTVQTTGAAAATGTTGTYVSVALTPTSVVSPSSATYTPTNIVVYGPGLPAGGVYLTSLSTNAGTTSTGGSGTATGTLPAGYTLTPGATYTVQYFNGQTSVPASQTITGPSTASGTSTASSGITGVSTSSSSTTTASTGTTSATVTTTPTATQTTTTYVNTSTLAGIAAASGTTSSASTPSTSTAAATTTTSSTSTSTGVSPAVAQGVTNKLNSCKYCLIAM